MEKYRDRELEISRKASHIDYCIKMHAYFEEDGKFNFVYELCADGDLTDHLAKQPE